MNIYSDRKSFTKITKVKPVINNWLICGGLNLIRGGYRHVRMRKL